MGDDSKKTKKTKKPQTAVEKLQAAAPPRPKSRYNLGLAIGLTGAPASGEDAVLPPADEHSSFNEQPLEISAHEQSSQNEQPLSRDAEQTLSRDNEQTSDGHSSLFSEEYVKNFLAKNNISVHYIEVFAFIDYIASQYPGSVVGRVVYETFIKGPAYATIRRALGFWEKCQAIKGLKRTMGTTWTVDPVFSRVMGDVFRLPKFPPFDQSQFLSGNKITKKMLLIDSRNEQTSDAAIDRKIINTNLSISSELTDKGIEECWPNFYNAGFRVSHYRQIAEAFKTQALELENIPMFIRFIEYELENGLCKDAQGMVIEKPVSWFVVSMKKGQYRQPSGYEDPRAYAERMRLKEIRDNLDRECELKFLEDQERMERMKAMVESLQNDLADNGLNSPNFDLAKECCAGFAFDLVAQKGQVEWKNFHIGISLRNAYTKGYIAIEEVNGKPVIKKLKDFPTKTQQPPVRA